MGFDVAAFCEEHGIPESDLERYPLDGYTRKRRDGSEDNPHRGRSVWLLPDTPSTLISAGAAFGALDKDGTASREGFHKMIAGLSQVVAGHDLPEYAQWYDNPDAVELAPSGLLTYVFAIVMNGEAPEDRPNASSRGRSGSTIRSSTAAKTSASNTDRPRLVNG